MIFEPLRKLFRPAKAKADLPQVPAGERYYVVGDIHGRLDLFEALANAIEADDRERGHAKSTVVLLGDLVDRGPESAGVLSFARDWQTRRPVRILAGNHEEMMLESLEDKEVLRHFLKHGGRETILSFGIKKKAFNALSMDEMQKKLPEIIPADIIDFVRGFEEMVIAGDYVFVHAGIDPARPLDEQKRKDLLWIRDRFLRHEGPLSKVVVHGHTIFDDVLDCGNRIGIDTGAFRSGVLTALVLEDHTRRSIKATSEGDWVAIKHEEYNA
ncbi:serine /threonine protein phosphatase [Altererythrobacter epoxidivorans]|uniref:Serine /threonine protein phosphatase n=1 Tax=Altererythrobacter epoxidivorans TaxID=361183 RepID=A0A0M4M928_9SPHN|nr:serine /threonine protein phosphatase [Altererythrobacter epoxidivorans]